MGRLIPKSAVIGLSGGMDSATLLGLLLEQGYSMHCCIVNYGSKHNKWENAAAHSIIDFYQKLGAPVFPHQIDLEPVFADFKSNLLKEQGQIPEGHYNSDSMKLTVVPGRNLIFASIMAGLAESVEAKIIALGVHSGDHHIYPDCRKEFVKALDSTIYLSSDRKVQVLCPLIDDDKTSILKKGYSLNPPVPYGKTRTCYKDQELSCGKCGSCQERLEAFRNIGKQDPIWYEIPLGVM